MKKSGSSFRVKLKGSMKSSFFRKNLLLFSLISILPIAIISISIYFTGIRQIETEVNRTHSLQLDHVFTSMNEQLTQLELSSNRWSFYPAFDTNLRSVDLSKEIFITMDFYRIFEIINNSSPLIKNVQLYLNDQGAELSENGTIYLNGNSKQNYYKELLSTEKQLMWVNTNLPTITKDSSLNMALVQKVPGGRLEAYGLFYITLDERRIQSMIDPLIPDGQGAAFILNTDGNRLISGNTDNTQRYNLEESLRAEILKKPDSSGSFRYDWEGSKYAVTYGTFTRTGWKFVVAAPLSRLTAPVVLVTRLIAGVCIFVLLLGLFLSWIASNRVYKPVKRLVNMFNSTQVPTNSEAEKNEIDFLESSWNNLFNEKKVLKYKLDQSVSSLKEGFLLQLLQGHLYFLSEKELNEQMEQYWWKVEGKCFFILLIRLDFTLETEGYFNKGDERLVSFAATNIVQELTCKNWGDSAAVNFHNLTVAALLPCDEALPDGVSKSMLLELAGNIISALTKHLGVSVSLVVSKRADTVKDIPQSLEETRQGLRYRDMKRDEQILDIATLIPQGDYQANYPFSVESSIVQSIRMGMEEDALELIEEFIQKLKHGMGEEILFRQGLFQLLGTVIHTLLKSGLNIQFLYQGSNLYEQLSKLNDSKQIVQWFNKNLISPYSREISKTREKQSERLVEKVILILDREYAQPISLESCATSQGVTAYALSKIFKHETGVNFIEYLTQIRIKKAKELLCKTDLKVNDIAEMVGYQPGYFVRTFKKLEGITPGQYKELHSKET